MAWLLIILLAVISIVALLAVLVLAGIVGDEAEAERVRVEMEVRRAERQLHDLARTSFEAMLNAARSQEPR
jgi:type II secretory pathway pseudopilin PulG